MKSPRRASLLALLFAVLSLLLVACGDDKDDKGDDPAAPAEPTADLSLGPGEIVNVNGTRVSQAEFDKLIEQARATAERQGTPFNADPNTAEGLRLRKDAVEYLVENERYEQKA
jgi:ABC-type oligopeptide transport system substrate-binding subunit